jgi:hypothetical protein
MLPITKRLSEPTTLGPEDIGLFGGIVVAYGVYRHILTQAFLVRIAALLRVKCQFKFIHRSFDLIHYASSAIIGSFALCHRPYGHCILWAKDCRVALLPTPGACVLTLFEKMYYMTFCVYYVVDVLFIRTVPNDMFALVCHHAATVLMIIFSVLLRVPVIGVVIMLLHDVVDVVQDDQPPADHLLHLDQLPDDRV